VGFASREQQKYTTLMAGQTNGFWTQNIFYLFADHATGGSMQTQKLLENTVSCYDI
jgi:uncharacterized protein YhbP (UPF0306 family)